MSNLTKVRIISVDVGLADDSQTSVNQISFPLDIQSSRIIPTRGNDLWITGNPRIKFVLLIINNANCLNLSLRQDEPSSRRVQKRLSLTMIGSEFKVLVVSVGFTQRGYYY